MLAASVRVRVRVRRLVMAGSQSVSQSSRWHWRRGVHVVLSANPPHNREEEAE